MGGFVVTGGWQGQRLWLGKSRPGESGGPPFWQLDPDPTGAHVFSTMAEAELQKLQLEQRHCMHVVSNDWDHGRKT